MHIAYARTERQGRYYRSLLCNDACQGRYYEWESIRDACLDVWMDYYEWKQVHYKRDRRSVNRPLPMTDIIPSMKSVVQRLRKNARLVNIVRNHFPIVMKRLSVDWCDRSLPAVRQVTRMAGKPWDRWHARREWEQLNGVAWRDRSLPVVCQEVMTWLDRRRRHDKNNFDVKLVIGMRN